MVAIHEHFSEIIPSGEDPSTLFKNPEKPQKPQDPTNPHISSWQDVFAEFEDPTQTIQITKFTKTVRDKLKSVFAKKMDKQHKPYIGKLIKAEKPICEILKTGEEEKLQRLLKEIFTECPKGKSKQFREEIFAILNNPENHKATEKKQTTYTRPDITPENATVYDKLFQKAQAKGKFRTGVIPKGSNYDEKLYSHIRFVDVNGGKFDHGYTGKKCASDIVLANTETIKKGKRGMLVTHENGDLDAKWSEFLWMNSRCETIDKNNPTVQKINTYVNAFDLGKWSSPELNFKNAGLNYLMDCINQIVRTPKFTPLIKKKEQAYKNVLNAEFQMYKKSKKTTNHNDTLSCGQWEKEIRDAIQLLEHKNKPQALSKKNINDLKEKLQKKTFTRIEREFSKATEILQSKLMFEVFQKIIDENLDPKNLQASDFSDMIFQVGTKTLNLSTEIEKYPQLKTQAWLKLYNKARIYQPKNDDESIVHSLSKDISTPELYQKKISMVFTGKSIFIKPEKAELYREKILEFTLRIDQKEQKRRFEMAQANPEKYNNKEFLRQEKKLTGYPNSNPWICGKGDESERACTMVIQPKSTHKKRSVLRAEEIQALFEEVFEIGKWESLVPEIEEIENYGIGNLDAPV